MHFILCIDNNGGLAFHNRRQSQDRALREHLLQLVGNARLWMNGYSRKQFPDPVPANLVVDEDFLKKAAPDDYCFVETLDPSPYEAQIRTLILFCWNRDYPADTFFTRKPDGWKLVDSQDFPGFSHETITKEVYRR